MTTRPDIDWFFVNGYTEQGSSERFLLGGVKYWKISLFLIGKKISNGFSN